jgi:YD repeat-containing protein
VLPEEAVDPFSGTLSIVATDLVLPGNAGLDVRVQRVYSSAIYPGYNNDNFTPEEDSWAGIGWKLHFGRVLHPNATASGATQIEMSDGSRHALYSTPDQQVWITKGFWLYNRSAATLTLPNGTVYTFGHVAHLDHQLDDVRYVTQISDPFGNHITFTYFIPPAGPADGVSQVTQHLGGGQTRVVTFAYDAALNTLKTMTYDNKTWQYEHQAVPGQVFSLLKETRQPGGHWVRYGYSTSQPAHELTSLAAFAGGTITYTYQDVIQTASGVTNKGRGVYRKVTGGLYITSGTWEYTYGTGPNHDTTVVTCPCGTTTYQFNGIGDSGDFSGWKAGTLAKQTIADDSGVLETHTFAWLRSEPISPDDTTGVGAVWNDSDVFKALLDTHTTTRGAGPWQTVTNHDYHTSDFNDYGQPWKTVQSGDFRRTTTRTFQHTFTPYIRARVTQEQVQVGPEIFERTWMFHSDTGFMTAEAIGGGTITSYTPFTTNNGNVATATDALGNPTHFLYSWGRVSQISTPNVTTTLVINPDGSVASESIGGLVTLYEYDGRRRLKTVKPPGTHSDPTAWISNYYDNFDTYGADGYISEGRTPADLKHLFDGFGRVRRTEDQAGVKTRIERDACGRTVFESFPYHTGSSTQGVTTTYDGLHRPKTVTVGSGPSTQYAYGGANVTVTDPNGRQTLYEYSVFGSADDRLLTRVKDADNKYTGYRYDAFGNLNYVNGPNATGLPGSSPERLWSYNARNQLLSETQPENGTTTYFPDAAGNVTKIRDARGEAYDILFTYDGNNRLKTRNAPGTADDLEITYNTAGQVWKMSSPTELAATTRTTLSYDAFGRVGSRQDFVNAQHFVSGYTYLTNDALDTITYPSGRIIDYDYDNLGRLSVVKNTGSLFANNFIYNDSGRLSGYQTGTVQHTFTYDTRQRIQRIQAGGPSDLDLTYDYDQAHFPCFSRLRSSPD